MGIKGCNAPRAAGFQEERNPPQADSVVYCKCIILVPYNISILPYYCNNVPYYENSIAKYSIVKYHIMVTDKI